MMELQNIQHQLQHQYTDILADQEKNVQIELEKLSLMEESIMQQKARAHWIKLGDANIKYFTAIMKERNQRKYMNSLVDGSGRTLTKPEEIQRKVTQFYQGLMGTRATELPAVSKLIMRNGPSLTHSQQLQLCVQVTKKEINAPLQAIGYDKAPGVDGYNAVFFKKAWPVIKQDVYGAVMEFFQENRFYKAVNCTSLTLLPKVEQPKGVREYRPIACCTVLYKIIAKILAARMQPVMASIIHEAQSGFMPGRKIADNIIMAHELVKAYQRKGISPRMMMKVDLQKAYDSVEWSYLEQVMEFLGSPQQFMKWISMCVKTVHYTICINGEYTEPFDAAKGLRQGDPISPYLFAIAMEYLSRILGDVDKQTGFKYHPKCAKQKISHLSFADDLLLVARGDLSSTLALNNCFQIFTGASGLKANKNKSSIYFGGVRLEEQHDILHQVGFTKGELPFKYLGVPLDTKKLKTIQWYPLVEKIVARIKSWTTKKLSYAGRIRLVGSVLFGIQAYWSQLFVLPAKIMKLIEGHCRSYSFLDFL